MSLNEKIKEVLQSEKTLTAKKKDLIDLGLKSYDIENLFRLYEVAGDTLFTLGIEIECFNVDRDAFIAAARSKGVKVVSESYNHTARNYYKVVRDSSIQGSSSVECVSPVLKGKAGMKSLKVICDSLNIAGARVNRSCGLHVHVGLQNISFEQYKNLFFNYIKLEGVIDSFLAYSRRDNNNGFCMSNKGRLIEIDCSTNMQKIAEAYNSCRYYKLNPVSYSRHNTIEFRQHQGTTDYNKIEKWVSFICKLVEFSKNNRLTESVMNISDIPFLNEEQKTYFVQRALELSSPLAETNENNAQSASASVNEAGVLRRQRRSRAARNYSNV